MPQQQDPQKLEYFTQPKPTAPKQSPFRKMVALFGFFVYGAASLPFYLVLVMAAETFINQRRVMPISGIVLAALFAAACTWRALHAFRQFLR
jgi:hypothetical protein